MKKFLQEMLKRAQARLTELQTRSEASENIDEVRMIGREIDSVNEEIRSINAQIAALDVEPQGPQEGLNPMASYGLRGGQPGADQNDLEYRTAFMNNVLHNTPIPQELRVNQSTLTTDVQSAIPTTLVNQIIERMDEYGMILPLVTRTSYSAGVVIPTSTVKPVATWTSEGSGSDKQKKATGKITFAYFKLRCEISMSMEVGTMALAAFEAKFVENVANAMVIAIEKAIISGDGTTQPKGILKETPSATVELAKKAEPTYKELVAAEGKVKAEFEATSKWFMTKAQFMNFVGMTDQQGQPIARVNYGINGKPERMLLGREVIVHPYAEEMGSTVAFIVDPADYILNTIYDMGISKKQDWDTEDLLTKAVMSVDGKMADAGSLITITAAA